MKGLPQVRDESMYNDPLLVLVVAMT